MCDKQTMMMTTIQFCHIKEKIGGNEQDRYAQPKINIMKLNGSEMKRMQWSHSLGNFSLVFTHVQQQKQNQRKEILVFLRTFWNSSISLSMLSCCNAISFLCSLLFVSIIFPPHCFIEWSENKDLLFFSFNLSSKCVCDKPFAHNR